MADEKKDICPPSVKTSKQFGFEFRFVIQNRFSKSDNTRTGTDGSQEIGQTDGRFAKVGRRTDDGRRAKSWLTDGRSGRKKPVDGRSALEQQPGDGQTT